MSMSTTQWQRRSASLSRARSYATSILLPVPVHADHMLEHGLPAGRDQRSTAVSPLTVIERRPAGTTFRTTSGVLVERQIGSELVCTCTATLVHSHLHWWLVQRV